jgi:hypothetical protein
MPPAGREVAVQGIDACRRDLGQRLPVIGNRRRAAQRCRLGHERGDGHVCHGEPAAEGLPGRREKPGIVRWRRHAQKARARIVVPWQVTIYGVAAIRLPVVRVRAPDGDPAELHALAARIRLRPTGSLIISHRRPGG